MKNFIMKTIGTAPLPGEKRMTAAEEVLERQRQANEALRTRRAKMLTTPSVFEARSNLMRALTGDDSDDIRRAHREYATAREAARRAEEAMMHAKTAYSSGSMVSSFRATTSSGVGTVIPSTLGSGVPSSGPTGVGRFDPALKAHPAPATNVASGHGVTPVVFDFGKLRDLPVAGDIVADDASGRLFEVVRLELARGFRVTVVGYELNSDMFTLTRLERRVPLNVLRPATEDEIKSVEEAA